MCYEYFSFLCCVFSNQLASQLISKKIPSVFALTRIRLSCLKYFCSHFPCTKQIFKLAPYFHYEKIRLCQLTSLLHQVCAQSKDTFCSFAILYKYRKAQHRLILSNLCKLKRYSPINQTNNHHEQSFP